VSVAVALLRGGLTLSENKRQLVITVGTSLFESASWDPEKLVGDLAVPGYEAWCQEGKLQRLEARKATPGFTRVSKALFEKLDEDDRRDALTEAFDKRFDMRGRYSAEIATLIALRPRFFTKTLHEGFPEFLKGAYLSTLLIHGDARDDKSRVAALHLEPLLHTLGAPVQRQELSSDLAENSRQLHELLRKMTGSVDLVASGGYKAQAILMAQEYQQRTPAEAWRLFYLHESSDLIAQVSSGQGRRELVVQSGNHWDTVELQ
jgi:hypothetical protein